MRLYTVLLALVLLTATLPISAQQSHSVPTMPGFSITMQKSMDPQTYNNMFNLMGSNMNWVTSPAPLCAQCHEGDDMERYTKTLLPMYQLMMNPNNWMNPNAYMQAAVPMMDPQTYMQWYAAWMKIAGEMYGAPIPGMSQGEQK